jgi:hypothetical protein
MVPLSITSLLINHYAKNPLNNHGVRSNEDLTHELPYPLFCFSTSNYALTYEYDSTHETSALIL